MTRFEKAKVTDMPLFSRFYFVGDRNKVVFEKIDKSTVKNTMQFKDTKAIKENDEGIFLRIAK